MKILVTILSIVFLFGCTHLKFPEIPEYKIDRSQNFVISQSPELWRFFARDYRFKERKVDLILRNISKEDQVLAITQARVQANQSNVPLECTKIGGEKADIPLKPGESARVICPVVLQPDEKNQLGTKDTIAKILIPNGKQTLGIEMLFRIEEFQ